MLARRASEPYPQNSLVSIADWDVAHKYISTALVLGYSVTVAS